MAKSLLIEIEELKAIVDCDKNADEGIDISKLYTNSAKEIDWKCEKGHTFKEAVGIMYKRKNKCFFCTGRQIWPGENDLETLYPELAEEFDVGKNGITPNRISPRDTNTYWWTCAEKHPSFSQSVEHRVARKTVCPYCAGRKAIPGENDLETLYPDIAKEWDYENNKGVLPRDVLPNSYNSYAWICPKGHHYKKKVVFRTKFHQPIDCTKCIKARSTSFPEQAIYYYVKKCFPDALNKYKDIFDKGMELDIYIPSMKIAIEYDGEAFHKDEDQHKREFKKYEICKKHGIKLIRVKEAADTWNDTADDMFFVKKRMKDKEIQMFLWSLFSMAFALKSHTFATQNDEEAFYNRHIGFPTNFDVSKDRPEILEYLIDVENSFGALHPEEASLWSIEDNGDLTPFMFTSGSNYPAIWKCPKCGKTWPSTISSVVSRKVRYCKNCSMKENGKTITKAKTSKYGSLAERSELLLKQWDFEANGDLSPKEIPLNYSNGVAWKCDVCGYKWSSSPNSRVRKDSISGCPHCTGRVAMPGVDDLETLYPEVAKTWDYERNGDTLPSQIKPYANRKYYWICPTCNKSYPAFPGNRVEGHGCSACGHVKVGKNNSKEVGQYNEAGELINTFYGLHEAARAMGVGHNAIFQAVKNGGRSKGFYWKYID